MNLPLLTGREKVLVKHTYTFPMNWQSTFVHLRHLFECLILFDFGPLHTI
jgi:hypothetical protein